MYFFKYKAGFSQTKNILFQWNIVHSKCILGITNFYSIETLIKDGFSIFVTKNKTT